MAERQSAADAFSGFLAPSAPPNGFERVRLREAYVEATPPEPVVADATAELLTLLTSGKPQDAEKVRVATGLPPLRFARAVADLERADLVEVRTLRNRETLSITSKGRAALEARA